MEFERVGKPVPVITAEVSEEIEALIKRRILAREFDEVVRRHPDAIGSASETRRGRVEVDDTKPETGLAEVYEQEHLRATDPGYVDKRSASTKKQHDEISRLWKEVSAQLDLLSNLHFKPRRVEAEIKTVEDKPTISMEDARPAGMGVNGDESMLAPQEVYRPGEEKTGNGVIVRKGGSSAAKDEMSREEKHRKRRREKERIKKANQYQGQPPSAGASSGKGTDGAAVRGKKSKAADQQDILTQLRKGNVKVIGKKGEVESLGGKKERKGQLQDVARENPSVGAASLKL
jgi:U3 small nucleolar RNA-associated protein MPP10